MFYILMRLVFDNTEQRKLFFNELMSKNNSASLNKLSVRIGINPKSMSDYYRGRSSVPDKIFRLLSLKQFSGYRLIQDNWGSKLGGREAFKKNKLAFDKGRQKAILISKNRKPLFDIYMNLDSDLSYFIGLFIGDGFANTYQSYYIVQFAGDKRSETIFYSNYVSNIVKRLFKINPKMHFDKDGNGLRFNLYSRELFHLLTQRFKIKTGRKSHTVLIPDEILNSVPSNIKSCIRGLYDAEGCVFFDKRKEYKKPYPRIELHMCNLALLKQVSMILTKLGIHNVVGKSKKNLRVTIWGLEEVKKFTKKIGFSNPKQLEKLRLGGLV